MPNTTTNFGFNIFLESEIVNWEHINANFEKLDGMILCTESGTKTSSYTRGSDSVATWRYKKYSDGTIDMNTVIYFTNLKCNGGSKAPYYSGTSNLYFPFQLSSVYNVQMHLASNTVGWVSNITSQTVSDMVAFRVMSMEYENTAEYKQVFINVKGVLA